MAAPPASSPPSHPHGDTLRPWVEASVGPQLVAAYVQTVLVRPGDAVKRGEVLATLDCRNAQTAMTAVAHQALAIEKSQRALSNQAERTTAMLDGGFVSSGDELEQKNGAEHRRGGAARRRRPTWRAPRSR